MGYHNGVMELRFEVADIGMKKEIFLEVRPDRVRGRKLPSECGEEDF